MIDFYPRGRKGKRVRFALHPNIQTEEEAREIEKDLIRANQSSLKPVLSEGTVAELFDQYLSWYSIHRSPTTNRDLNSVFENHFHPHLGAHLCENVGLEHINYFKVTRQRDGASNRTISKELSYFGGFLKWAERNGHITHRMFRIERLPHKRPLPLVLSPTEANSILSALVQPYRAFVTALYTLGLRFSEAAGLAWENIDLEGKAVKIRQKGGSWKILPLNPRVEEEILSLGPSREGLVFRSRRTGGPIRDIRKALARAKKAAGITKHINPHLFRHSIATTLMDSGVNLRVIQGYLGHSDLATTQWYTHVAMESLKTAENAILGLVPEKTKGQEIKRLPGPL